MSPSNSARGSPEPPADCMQIYVKNVAGQPAIPLSVPAETTIATLRSLLVLRTNLRSQDIRLVFAGKHLTDPASSLADYAIGRDAVIHLALPTTPPRRKIRCSFKDCKDGAQRIVGDCGFCSGHFCGKHRLLEDHKWPGLEDCKKESHERNAVKLNAERTVAIRGI